MKDREYSGFVAKTDKYGYACGIEPVVFLASEVAGLSVIEGAGIPQMYFACLAGFRQVQLQKSVFERLLRAGKEVESYA